MTTMTGALAATALSDRVRHVIVLMLENRSFDHLAGFLRSAAYPVDGLTGDETNPLNPAAPSGPVVAVTSDAPHAPDLDPDPNHDVRDVTIQLYGAPVATPRPARHNDGFVYDYAQVPGLPRNGAATIMRCFAPPMLPVLSTLAQEFALCDRWHSSVPGPTWPNRLFTHAATSVGQIDDAVRDYGVRTIFENLQAGGAGWRVYFHDLPQSLALTNLRAHPGNFELFDEAFARDCAQDRLPAYAFIEPRYFTLFGWRANDQHPPHGVVPGELLIADVYEALRNSPSWETSVLIVVWDEHGGIYDHVLPPATVNPDGLTSPEFDFTRLGVRVPAVIVSPHIPRRAIDRTLYDHTSIAAFLKKHFELPAFLTKRDAQANTFEPLFTLASPRTDAPTALPRPSITPAPTVPTAPAVATMPPLSVPALVTAHALGGASHAPLTGHQRSLAALADTLESADSALVRALRRTLPLDEHTAAVHVQCAALRFLGR